MWVQPPTVSRRVFLRSLSWSSGLLAVAQLRGVPASAVAVPADSNLRVLSQREVEVLTAIVERMVDSGDATMPAVGATRTIATIDQALLQLDGDLRSQFRWLLPIFDWGAVVFRMSLRRFTQLAPDERDVYLRAWAESRFATCRLAFRALKNLSMLGYYSQDETWAGIHYGGPWAPRPRRVLSAEI